ncbi:shikimate kinase, partial [Blautia celeris]
GQIVYLKLDYDTLDKRLSNLKGRGVVLKEGQDLRGLYDERIPLYEKYADITVDEKNLDVEETLQKIVERLKQ